MPNLQISQTNSVTSLSASGLVLRELPAEAKVDAQTAICNMLKHLAKLYQIPNWDALNEVLLSDWILETYPTETMETITKALTKPRTVGKTWRLTPDVITEWMSFEIEQETAKREKELHNAKHTEESLADGWTDERFEQILDAIDKAPGFKRGPALNPQDVRDEGQKKPKERGVIYPYTTREEHVARAMRLAWMVECYDPRTGDKLPNWIDFDEWIRLNK